MGMNAKSKMEDLSSGRIGAMFNIEQGARNPDALHFHPHFEMLYIIRGVRALEFNGRNYKARAGDMLVFRPGDEHVEFMGTKHVSYFYLRFKPEELAGARIGVPEMLNSSPVLTLPRKGQFIEIFNRMLEEQDKGDEGRILLGAYLVEFLIKLKRAIRETLGAMAEGDGIESRILTAMEIIHRNLDGDLNLDQIARRTFMSSSHFSHTFKRRIGESPKKYQIRKRMEKAKELLAETRMSAAEIAEALGYNDPYFFYRQFKRKTGMTPSGFRSAPEGKAHKSPS